MSCIGMRLLENCKSIFFNNLWKLGDRDIYWMTVRDASLLPTYYYANVVPNRLTKRFLNRLVDVLKIDKPTGNNHRSFARCSTGSHHTTSPGHGGCVHRTIDIWQWDTPLAVYSFLYSRGEKMTIATSPLAIKPSTPVENDWCLSLFHLHITFKAHMF